MNEQNNPFNEDVVCNNKKITNENAKRSSENFRPSLISGKAVSRYLELRKSHEDLSASIGRGLILGHGEGDTTSANMEGRSPDVKVDLKAISGFIAKVAADAQLLGFRFI